MPKIATPEQKFNDRRSWRHWGMPDLSRKLDEMSERFKAAPGYIEPTPEENAQAVQELERFFAGRMRVDKPRIVPVFSPAAIDCRISECRWRIRAGLNAGPPPPQKEGPQRQLGADGNVRCLSTDSNLAGKKSQRIFGEARCCAPAEAFFRSRINYLIFCRIFVEPPRARAPPSRRAPQKWPAPGAPGPFPSQRDHRSPARNLESRAGHSRNLPGSPPGGAASL
jgi:hypothetical protein